MSQGAIDEATRYAADRRQFDQRVIEFEGIQFMLADMASQTEAARQLTYAAAARVDADASDLAYWTSCAKLIAGDTAMRVTTDAVQVLGGYGYIVEYPVERMMRDAKITQLYEGTQQIQRLIIARQILQRAGVGASEPQAGAASPVKIVVTVKQVPATTAEKRYTSDLRLDRAVHRVGRQSAGRVRHRAGAAAPGVRCGGRGRLPVDGAGVGGRGTASRAGHGRRGGLPGDR